jgi:hypothetical protein
VEEIRSTSLRLQLRGNEISIQSSGVSVTAELGRLFHLIECLSSNGMIQPEIDDHKNIGQVKAYVPSNFIAAFTQLPEATNLVRVQSLQLVYFLFMSIHSLSCFILMKGSNRWCGRSC